MPQLTAPPLFYISDLWGPEEGLSYEGKGPYISPPGQGQRREEAWVPILRNRNRKAEVLLGVGGVSPRIISKSLSTLRILEPLSLRHSSCLIFHPADVSREPDMCQASFTRHQKCRNEKINCKYLCGAELQMCHAVGKHAAVDGRCSEEVCSEQGCQTQPGRSQGKCLSQVTADHTQANGI